MIAVTIQFLPPFILIVYGTIGVNDAMDPIVNLCYTIMASPSYDPSVDSDYFTASAESTLFNCPDHDDGEFAEQTAGAMKLALLIEKTPCVVLLLGWRISMSSVVTSIAAILLSQALGAVGLGG